MPGERRRISHDAHWVVVEMHSGLGDLHYQTITLPVVEDPVQWHDALDEAIFNLADVDLVGNLLKLGDASDVAKHPWDDFGCGQIDGVGLGFLRVYGILVEIERGDRKALFVEAIGEGIVLAGTKEGILTIETSRCNLRAEMVTTVHTDWGEVHLLSKV